MGRLTGRLERGGPRHAEHAEERERADAEVRERDVRSRRCRAACRCRRRHCRTRKRKKGVRMPTEARVPWARRSKRPRAPAHASPAQQARRARAWRSTRTMAPVGTPSTQEEGPRRAHSLPGEQFCERAHSKSAGGERCAREVRGAAGPTSRLARTVYERAQTTASICPRAARQGRQQQSTSTHECSNRLPL
jgi:hypothetical protein